MAIQLHFMLALSGNTLGVVRVNLPWRPDLELLSQQLGQSVHTYLVDCSREPVASVCGECGNNLPNVPLESGAKPQSPRFSLGSATTAFHTVLAPKSLPVCTHHTEARLATPLP